jgi:hypothetical protein
MISIRTPSTPGVLSRVSIPARPFSREPPAGYVGSNVGQRKQVGGCRRHHPAPSCSQGIAVWRTAERLPAGLRKIGLSPMQQQNGLPPAGVRWTPQRTTLDAPAPDVRLSSVVRLCILEKTIGGARGWSPPESLPLTAPPEYRPSGSSTRPSRYFCLITARFPPDQRQESQYRRRRDTASWRGDPSQRHQRSMRRCRSDGWCRTRHSGCLW